MSKNASSRSPGPDKAMRFDAFISYSHYADSQFSEALEYHLERFAKPWYRLNAANVFRDETNLHASPELWGQIIGNLDNARHLILLASPESARSVWVQREITHWLTNGAHDDPGELSRERVDPGQASRFLIVLTSGTIEWDDRRGDFRWEATTSLPDCLRDVFPHVPLWIDALWAKAEPRPPLTRANRDFVKVVAKLSAPIRGLDIETLLGLDHAEHRRTKRHIAAAASVCAALAAGSSWFAWKWHLERQTVVLRDDEVRAGAYVKAAQTLAREAPRRSGPPSIAAALYAHQLNEQFAGGMRRSIDDALRSILDRPYAWNPLDADRIPTSGDSAPRIAAIGDDGEFAAGNDATGALRILRLGGRRIVELPHGLRESVERFVFADGGRRMAVHTSTGRLVCLRLGDATDADFEVDLPREEKSTWCVSDDGSTIVVAVASGLVIHRKGSRREIGLEPVGPADSNPPLPSLCVSADGAHCCVARSMAINPDDYEQRLRIDAVSTDSPGVPKLIHPGISCGESTAGLAGSPDGRFVALVGSQAESQAPVLVWDIRESRGPWQINSMGESVSALRFSPDSHWLALGGARSGVDGIPRPNGLVVHDLHQLAATPPVDPATSPDANDSPETESATPAPGRTNAARITYRLAGTVDTVAGIVVSADATSIYAAQGDEIRAWRRGRDGFGEPVVMSGILEQGSFVGISLTSDKRVLRAVAHPLRGVDIDVAPARSAPVELQNEYSGGGRARRNAGRRWRRWRPGVASHSARVADPERGGQGAHRPRARRRRDALRRGAL